MLRFDPYTDGQAQNAAFDCLLPLPAPHTQLEDAGGPVNNNLRGIFWNKTIWVVVCADSLNNFQAAYATSRAII